MSAIKLAVCGAFWAAMFATPIWAQADAPSGIAPTAVRYEPNWESLDRRPNPAWFDDDKIGIFLHWGVYSVPAVAWNRLGDDYMQGGISCLYECYIERFRSSPADQTRYLQFHHETYGDISYWELAPLFKAKAFDPAQWAELFKRSGAR